MALSKVRSCDSKFQNLVFGYIRRIEEQDKICTVPVVLKHLCLKYYIIKVFFNGYARTQMIISHKSNERRSKYLKVEGNNDIIVLRDTSITKYKWTFKLLSLPSSFTSWDERSITFELTSPKIPSLWVFKVRRSRHFLDYVAKNEILPDKPAIGDMIELIFDVRSEEIYWIINNNKYMKYAHGFYIEDEDRLKLEGLRLALKLPEGASIELVSFIIEQ